MKPLDGIKVIELTGLAPGPFCGMVLADFGADVIKVERPEGMPLGSNNVLSRGKRSIILNLKNPDGVNILLRLLQTADVLLDPYRPGVLEKLGLGPDVVLQNNPRLIYARLTGFGQSGPYADLAGHDMNFMALSGLLSLVGRAPENPFPPPFLVGDFAGGGLFCTLGILLALIARSRSNKGQIIDAAIVDGLNYFGAMIFNLHEKGKIRDNRGTNFLDGGAPYYNTYKTLDNQYMAVAALEPKFFTNCLSALGFSEETFPPQQDRTRWDEMKEKFGAVFASKSQAEWTQVFAKADACVSPVLTLNQVKQSPYHQQRHLFIRNNEGELEPAPAPQLQDTPGEAAKDRPAAGQHTTAILAENGWSGEEITHFMKTGAIK